MESETSPHPHTLTLSVTDGSEVGEARRTAAATANRLGFDEAEVGDLSIIVTEAAANLVHHGGGGELLLNTLHTGPPQRVGLEVLALDQGRGMSNVAQCLRDGYSTRGTTGTGLGAIARLSHAFDIHSQPGVGTAVLARLWHDGAEKRRGLEADRIDPPAFASPPPRLEIGGVRVPKPGQSVSGDAWASKQRDGAVSILVADGLGHGPDAARASEEAVRTFLNHDLSPEALLTRAHRNLRKTRGAAVAIAHFPPNRSEVQYWGAGNITGTVLHDQKRFNLLSHHGTVGVILPRLQGFPHQWTSESLMALHSDGLTARWRLDQYAGLWQRDVTLIASVLYRDFRRGSDDCTVVIARPRRHSDNHANVK